MKRKIFFVAIVLSVFLAGCKKEGVYNPKYKISGFSEYSQVDYQRYLESRHTWESYRVDSTKVHRTERWDWKDGKLSGINYFIDGKIDLTLSCEYDGKRLEKIRNTKNGSIAVYFYDGKSLSSIRFVDKNGNVEHTMHFNYDDGKISSIDVVAPGKGEGALRTTEALENVVLGQLLPGGEKIVVPAKGASNNDYSVTLAWKDDNIQSATNTQSQMTVKYKYDKFDNPYKGFLGTILTDAGYAFANKNNVTSIEYPDNTADNIHYSYTYSENIPVTRVESRIDNYAAGYRNIVTTIIYFDYFE